MNLKWLFGMATVCIIAACAGGNGASKVDAATVFKTHCQLCHGADGKLGLNNAKDLTASPFTLEERIQIITEGRNTMLSYKNTLTEDEIAAVAQYTLDL